MDADCGGPKRERERERGGVWESMGSEGGGQRSQPDGNRGVSVPVNLACFLPFERERAESKDG